MAGIDRALVAGDADGGATGSLDGVGREAKLADAVLDRLLRLRADVGCKNDQHAGLIPQNAASRRVISARGIRQLSEGGRTARRTRACASFLPPAPRAAAGRSHLRTRRRSPLPTCRRFHPERVLRRAGARTNGPSARRPGPWSRAPARA